MKVYHQLRFRKSRNGNYWSPTKGSGCTVFKGPLGGWSYFLNDEPAGQWWDTANEAKQAARDAYERPHEKPKPTPEHRKTAATVPPCFRFFGLSLPTTRDALNAEYRKRVLIFHPDRGGDAESFKVCQRHFEEALQLL